MKTKKLLIFLIAAAFLLSVGVACASEDIGDDLTSDSEIDSVGEIDVADQPQEELTSQEDDYVANDNSDGDVLAEPVEPTYVITGKVTDRQANGVVYTATFYDSDGTPLKESHVFCGVDSKDLGINANTDSNGVAKFSMKLKNGVHKLYLSNDYMQNPIEDTIKVFDVLSGNKDVKMYYDDGGCYQVRVYGDDGKPVKAGEKVTFYVGTKKYSSVTDKNGFAKLKLTQKPGLYQVAALYKNFAVSNSALIKNVLKVPNFNTKKLKATFKFKVKYLGKNKKNKKIKVKFNKKTYKAKTNKKGIAIFKLKTPKKLGKYKVKVTYKKCQVAYEMTKYRL